MTREFAAMAELSVSVDVLASVDRVWAALTDWDRQGEWMLGTRVRGTVGDGRGVGGQIEAVTGIGPLRIRDKMRVTRWEPPHVCLVVHYGRLVRGTGGFVVREHPAGATVVWSEALDLPLGLLGRLGWPVIRPAVRWGLTRSLRRFARWATTG
jgi:carbon monoxide dehydrogenase subunit G